MVKGKGCLSALDGTHINVIVSTEDKPRFLSRKGQISTNTLAACDRNLQLVYALPGWEGSAGNSRVLRDAVTRVNELKVPKGEVEGVLTPFRGVRYHLKEWASGTDAPQNAIELFNMRHTKARNVIERAFAVLKMRWGILRSASFYPIKMQIRLIMACFLLHNFIRREMAIDPIKSEIDGADLGVLLNGDNGPADKTL
ncbi:putative nuclease HARBI1 [Salvia splendens]|uniref:putative nuclease HARBI1 n=1 Tax=Salvia splendens TaxID=180675 RepID=UPI001C253A8A|nr:putative nuclease HARBI1 [Salvia splendens]